MKVAADIMTTEVVTINSLANILQAARVMNRQGIKTLIVDRASFNDAYGIISQTDISRAIANGKDPARTRVGEVMTKPCIVVNPNLSVEHVIKLFAQVNIRTAPVIKNQLLGIVSLTDIITKTDYLTLNKVKPIVTGKLTELPSDRLREDEWKIADWEEELENWCSG
ncbi:MAG: CBS domain-containing protein [Cyanobacteria bacterium J06635_13]